MKDNKVPGCICTKCGCKDVIKRYDRKRKKYFAHCTKCNSQDISQTCTECGSGNLTRDDKRAEIVCRDCGLVLARPFYSVGSHSFPLVQKNVQR